MKRVYKKRSPLAKTYPTEPLAIYTVTRTGEAVGERVRMSEQTEGSAGSRQDAGANRPTRSASHLNWALIRKMETLIFASMLVAIPFFALRVVDYTATQLAVRNTAVDLVKDLIRAKEISKNFGLSVSVTGRLPAKGETAAYLLQNGPRTIEEVLLPPGVNVIGSITFNEQGIPDSRTSFTISKGAKKMHVDVDSQGVASMP